MWAVQKNLLLIPKRDIMYKKQLQNNFEKWFHTSDCFSEETKNFILKSRNDYPCYYSDLTKEYYKEYFGSLFDASISFYDQGKPIFYLPMFLFVNSNSKLVLSTNGETVYPPVFNSDLTLSYIKKVSKKIIGFILDFLKEINGKSVVFLSNTKIFNGWEAAIIDASFKETMKYKYYIDLTLDLSEIKTCLRDSYKSLVNKSLRMFNFEVIQNCSDELIEEFKEFHFQVSSKRTRNHQSCLIQQKQVNNGEGFIIRIQDNDNKLIGLSLFLYNQFEGLYAVGVYDRKLFDKPISHGAQWLAIQKLKELEVKNYFVGDFHPIWQQDNITEKEQQIENFKRGFATHIQAQPIWTVRL